jgi:hypothetical protein
VPDLTAAGLAALREVEPMSRPDDDSGVVFPRGADGVRSSTAVGREVVAAALDAVAPAQVAAVRAERDWRNNYPRHLKRLVEASLASTDAPLAAARAGPQAMAAAMRFARAARDSISRADAGR